MVRDDIFRTRICQLLATACLLFWHGAGYAEALPITAASSRLSYLYWFLALLLCLLAGYFMGSRRRMDEESYQESIEKKLSASEQRLKKQQAALATLSTDQLNDWRDPEEIFRGITKISAETLNVERVSIWRLSEDKEQLECLSLYLKSKNLHTIAKPLQAKDLPNYFNQLSQHRISAINDVFNHPATSEFTLDYLQDNAVGAMLDGSILLDNQIVGVICHEHVGGAREWTLDEQSFAGSVADLVRLTVKSNKLLQVEGDLLYQQKNLEKIVKTRIAAIERNAKLFRFMVERAPVSILYMSTDYEIIEMNPEAERVFGYSREYAIGKTYQELFSTPQNSEIINEINKKVAVGEKVQAQEIAVRCADGSTLDLSVSRTMELDADGAPVIISIGLDMSKQKALEASLISAREAAESADRIKSMFVASMSHELRTPLNSIIGFLGVVLQGMSGELNVKQKDQLGRAYHSAKHLLSLISDVIDISKIEAGFLNVHVEKFEFRQLLHEVEHAVEHIANEKQLNLYMDCPDKLMLETDRKRLYQVVLNVVSNALKYTEKGTVKVAASVKSKQLFIAVEDTGIGIDEASLANLFKPFERVDSRLRIKTLGTGLGLYLTRKILSQLLGGTIEVKSIPEQGSTFTIIIPTKMPELIVKNASILEEPHSAQSHLKAH